MFLSVIGLMGIAMQTPIQSNGENEVLDLLPLFVHISTSISICQV